jgi:hypothetical protein
MWKMKKKAGRRWNMPPDVVGPTGLWILNLSHERGSQKGELDCEKRVDVLTTNGEEIWAQVDAISSAELGQLALADMKQSLFGGTYFGGWISPKNCVDPLTQICSATAAEGMVLMMRL